MQTEKMIHTDQILNEKYYSVIHKSGLKVYVFPKDMTTTHAQLGVNYGSADVVGGSFDDNGEIIKGSEFEIPPGTAHFLEHKMFSNKDGSDSFEKFAALGADANAFTTFNSTVYLFNTTENVYECLEELLTFVTSPYFTEGSVKKEKEIILQEIKMYDDNPYNKCFCNLIEGLYHQHSIKNNICGSEESLSIIDPKMLYKCHKTFYRPDNMALAVCGRVTLEQTINVVDKVFSILDLPEATGRVGHKFASELPRAALPRITQKMQVGKTLFCIGFKDKDMENGRERQKKAIMMSMLNRLLFSKSGEFFNALHDEGKLSPAFSSSYTVNEGFAFNSVSGESDDPEYVAKRLAEYICKVKRDGLDKKAFERYKRVVRAEMIMSFDSTESVADLLLDAALGNEEIFDCSQIIEEIRIEELEALIEDAFAPEKITVSTVVNE